nr:Dihydrofolate reductase [uncultured bacterium]
MNLEGSISRPRILAKFAKQAGAWQGYGQTDRRFGMKEDDVLRLRDELDLSLMVAMTPYQVIGRGNTIPWRIPSDMKRFQDVTLGIGTMLMGRLTWESLPRRPLRDRHHIVLTRTGGIEATEQVTPVDSFEAACEVVRRLGGKACVIGGTQVYELFFPIVSRLYVTCVHGKIEGDKLFPIAIDDLHENGWNWVSYNPQPKLRDERDEYPTLWFEWVRD